MIPGFLREVAENYAVLRYCATSSGHFLSTFRDNLSVPFSGFKKISFGFLDPEDGTDSLSRNIGNKLTLLAV